MKVSIESVDTVQRKLDFEIPAERVGQEVDKAYRTVQQQARLKGFRPGKAPRSVLERYFGEQVAEEVSSLLIQESYAEAIKEHDLQIVAQPHVVPEKLTPGQPFRYSAMVEVRPTVEIGDFEGIEVQQEIEAVSEEEVTASLQRLADSLTQLHPITDRETVEDGDVLTLDYTGLRSGRPLPGLEGKRRLVEMGRETLLPGFQENLIGTQKGRTVQFSVPMPQAQGQAEAEGQTPQESTQDQQPLLFRVKIHEIARKEVPELDDDFAKDHGECDTLEELKNKIRDDLEKAAERRSENQMHEALLAGVYEKNPFEVPPSLVQEQLRQLFVDAGIQRPEEDVSVGGGRLTDEMREEFTSRARQSVQSAFVMDALVTHLSLSVSDEEVQQKIAEISSANTEQQHQIEAFYAQEDNTQALQRQLLHEKAIQAVVDKAKINTVHKEAADQEQTNVAGQEQTD